MKLLFSMLASFWIIQLSVFAQTPMPDTTGLSTVSPEIQRVMKLLSGAGWADAQNLAKERESLATALPQIIASDTHIAALIAGSSAHSDLLMQAIYQGIVTAADGGTDCKELLPKFFDAVFKSSDPADIPDRLRIWVMRDTMLRNIAIRIVRSVGHRELRADEITEISANPSDWIKRIYPTAINGETSQSQVKSGASSASAKASTGGQVSQPVQPQVLKKAADAKQNITLLADPSSTRPWGTVVALIAAMLGLLWFLLKKRK